MVRIIFDVQEDHYLRTGVGGGVLVGRPGKIVQWFLWYRMCVRNDNCPWSVGGDCRVTLLVAMIFGRVLAKAVVLCCCGLLGCDG